MTQAWLYRGFSAVLSILCVAVCANAADFSPLRSTQIELAMADAGFDVAQQQTVLAGYDAYVVAFKEAMAGPVAKFQREVGRVAATTTEGQEWQRQAREAAQAIDSAEAGVMGALRACVKPGQEVAVDRVLANLAVRRDLAIAAAISGEDGDGGESVFEAFRKVGGQPSKVSGYDALAAAYIVERAALASRFRDLANEMPLRRLQAREKFPDPAMPESPLGVVDERVGERTNTELAAPPDPAAFLALLQAESQRQRDRWGFANSARAEVIKKWRDLDCRTLDSLSQALSIRERLDLFDAWWDHLSVYRRGCAPGRVSAEVGRFGEERYEAMRAGIDPSCESFLREWWPKARAYAIASAAVSGHVSILGGGDSPTTDLAASVSRTVNELRFLLGAAETTERLARGEAVPSAPQPATVDRGLPEGDAVSFSFQIEGDDIPPELGAFEGKGIILVAGEEIQFEGADAIGGALMVDHEPVVLQGTGSSAAALGASVFSVDQAIPFVLGGGPSRLPDEIKFDELKAVYEAGGVDGGLVSAVEMVCQDMHDELQPIRDEFKGLSRGLTPDGMFAIGAAGLSRVTPKDRERAAVTREDLRERLLAIEHQRLSDAASALVPAKGQPTVQWISVWRALESARGDCGLQGGGRGSPDPIGAVLKAKLTSADWILVAREMMASCADLTIRTKASAAARRKVRESDPFSAVGDAVTAGDGSVSITIDEERATSHRAAVKALRLADGHRAEAESQAIARIKAPLPAASAQRVQDAWDEQRFGKDLSDPTSMEARFDGALLLELPETVKSRVRELKTAWEAKSRAIRGAIVKLKEHQVESRLGAPIAGDQAAAASVARSSIKALQFERDEMNRAAYRTLIEALPADAAARIPPLQESSAG